MCGLTIKVEGKKVALINFAHKRWHQTKKAKPNSPDFLHPCKQQRGVFFTLLFSPCKEFPKSSRFSDLKICLHVDERSNRKGKAALVQKKTNQNPVCVDKASDYKPLRKTSLSLHSSRLQGSNPVFDNCTETRCSALEVKQTQG